MLRGGGDGPECAGSGADGNDPGRLMPYAGAGGPGRTGDRSEAEGPACMRSGDGDGKPDFVMP